MHGESVYEGHSGIDEDEKGDKNRGSSQEDTEESERPFHSTQTLNANRRASQKEPTSSFN